MNLLTVTCDRDLEQMILQAESINKFVVNPCRHWVFINEKNPDIEKWRSKLQHFYTRHELIFDVPDGPMHPQGWWSQQIYKILMSEKIQDDYLVLDSKNFFINPTNIDEFKDKLGHSFKWKVDDKFWSKTIIHYCRKLQVEPSFDSIMYPWTPFLIKQSVIKEFGDLNQFAKWFLADPDNNIYYDKYMPSEFLFYSIVGQKHNLIRFNENEGLYDTIWPNDYNKNDILFHIKKFNKKNTKMVGLHHKLLEQLDDNEKTAINLFLKESGLITQLTFPDKQI